MQNIDSISERDSHQKLFHEVIKSFYSDANMEGTAFSAGSPIPARAPGLAGGRMKTHSILRTEDRQSFVPKGVAKHSSRVVCARPRTHNTRQHGAVAARAYTLNGTPTHKIVYSSSACRCVLPRHVSCNCPSRLQIGEIT